VREVGEDIGALLTVEMLLATVDVVEESSVVGVSAR
jgi:hypothetical protein